MRRVPLYLLAVVALATAGCGSEGPGASIEAAWELQRGTHDGQAIPIVPSHPITIDFGDETATGTAACNAYGSNYRLDGEAISFTEFAITEMACAPEAVMTAESLYMAALAGIETIEAADGQLTMEGPRSDLLFTRLDPVSTADLTGKVWVLDGLVKGEAVSDVSGERATLELFSDGSFIGSTGCRTVTGSYIVSGAEVVFTELAAAGECPPDLTDQDSHVIAALEGGFRVEISGDSMTTWAPGDEGLMYRAGS